MALRDFVAVIANTDVARSNRFVVEIQPPNIPGLGIKPQEQINLMCQDVTFPGQNIRTSTDDLRQGPTREIAQAVTYGSINMTFICTPGLPEKLFFEAWQKLMFNHITWQAKFYRSYIGQIKLRQLDRKDLVRYGIILYEAYPKIIMAQDYSNTASDTIQTLQVEFNFHHWAMDEKLYANKEDVYGSHERGHAAPPRAKLAGTENFDNAQMAAWLRGDILSETGQTYAQAMNQATGGKSILSGATAAMATPAPAALAQATVVGGGKFGFSAQTVSAEAHPAADISSSAVLSSMMAGLGVLAGNTPKLKPVLALAMEYLGAVEQDPITGVVKELAAKASAGPTVKAWVDPNTGITHGSDGGKGILSMLTAASGKGSVMASTMTGGMVTAKDSPLFAMDAGDMSGVRQPVRNIGGGVAGLMSGIVANVSSARGATAFTGSKFGLTVSVAGLGLPMLSVGTMMSNASSLGGKASFGVDRGGDR